ncbi:hypothetical protein JCM19231_5340 [Vibrio ishigakensis]|uniref:Uncharacterized protein n=1 Tax=Vibrio ishigakensis TaxID=1481914 RepID=A0A0B8NNH3_9VIBR|nr:hypothetical protein JCM19231_5340 [Vibrio ishigakensis]
MNWVAFDCLTRNNQTSRDNIFFSRTHNLNSICIYNLRVFYSK